MKDTGLKDRKGKTIYEESVIGLRTLDSKKYYDKVKPRHNEERKIYEFDSLMRKSIFEPDKYDYYYCIDDLCGFGSTFEVIK